MKRIIRNEYEQLYTNKEDNLKEMNKCLEIYNLPKLNQEEIESLNRPIANKEAESVIKNLPRKKSLGPDDFIGESYQTFKELMLNALKLFQKIQTDCQAHFMRPASPRFQNQTKTPQENYEAIPLTNIHAKKPHTILAN